MSSRFDQLVGVATRQQGEQPPCARESLEHLPLGVCQRAELHTVIALRLDDDLQVRAGGCCEQMTSELLTRECERHAGARELRCLRCALDLFAVYREPDMDPHRLNTRASTMTSNSS